MRDWTAARADLADGALAELIGVLTGCWHCWWFSLRLDRNPGFRDSTKARAAHTCDGKGRQLAILVTPGQRHDSICARPLLRRIRVPGTALGRPRCRPDKVIAEKAYSSRRFRAYLRKRSIPNTIPEKTEQRWHRLARGTRITLLQPAQRLPRHRYQIGEDRHLLRSGGHTRVIPALSKIRLKTDPGPCVRRIPPTPFPLSRARRASV
ncbi:transposase [Streptomyces sp. NPDC007206]|uniref:transposase n=1 Tax=Streptomyces sp. NPDC007206 TaxID=3154317 RepID=UPI0033FB3DF0